MPLRMSRAWRFTLTIGFCLMVLGYRGEAWAQQPFAYPSQGQSTEQQAADNSECNQWAVGQSGFDPWRAQPYPQATMAAAPPPPPVRGGAVSGAARGAALGAVGGAIAGNAGKGAAIGAATGALAGVMRRRTSAREQAEWHQQQQATMARQQAAFADQQAAGQGTFDRAYSACMTARGYVVQ